MDDPILSETVRRLVEALRPDRIYLFGPRARVEARADPPLMRGALFHCQQAADHALKAFLTLREVAFRKTHDLDELGRLACRAERAWSRLAANSRSGPP